MNDPKIEPIKNALITFVRQRFSVPDSDKDFSADIHLFDYGYVDSFGAVDLNTFVEQTFAIKISQTDLVAYPLNTVQEIATFVAKRQQGLI